MSGGGASRRKGERGELEVVEIVHASGWPDAHRNFASGAAGFADIAHGPEGVLLECKRTERLRLRHEWERTTDEAIRRGDLLPVLATRWNGNRGRPASWLAITELEELLSLLYLRERR